MSRSRTVHITVCFHVIQIGHIKKPRIFLAFKYRNKVTRKPHRTDINAMYFLKFVLIMFLYACSGRALWKSIKDAVKEVCNL